MCRAQDTHKRRIFTGIESQTSDPPIQVESLQPVCTLTRTYKVRTVRKIHINGESSLESSLKPAILSSKWRRCTLTLNTAVERKWPIDRSKAESGRGRKVNPVEQMEVELR
ncbi:hypothetical protein AVEN_223545-1 [Araneus ventricosus]|uniref:Uncharacterized protein n=1 Tax=Araneus ventricosus TaxID=182803 RepID=A0A4Y2MX58_ARAVE|nr:hypothetical protein AVEN_223545-1 [Araneus ventricosus]